MCLSSVPIDVVFFPQLGYFISIPGASQIDVITLRLDWKLQARLEALAKREADTF